MIKIICSPCKSAEDANVFHLCVSLDVRRLIKVGNWCTCQCRNRMPQPDVEPTVMEIPKWLDMRRRLREAGEATDEGRLKIAMPDSEFRRAV